MSWGEGYELTGLGWGLVLCGEGFPCFWRGVKARDSRVHGFCE